MSLLEQTKQAFDREIAWIDPQPINTELLRVEPFDIKLVPAPFRDWVLDCSHRMDNAPPDFLAVSLMVALSAIIGDKITIKPKQEDDWAVTPNLWGALVGRPSSKKSPALKEGTRFIAMLDRESRLKHESDLTEYNSEEEFHSLEVNRAKKKSSGGIEVNRDEAKDSFLKVLGAKPLPPVRRRRFTNDATIEKLGELQRDNPHGILVCRDELTGFLRSLEREDRAQDRAYYLESWSGNTSFSYDRIGRGTIDIERNIVSILGAIQPGKLKSYLLARKRGDGDDGLLERFQLAVYPDANQNVRIDQSPCIFRRT
jgi:putative DNA primase/helicase